MIPGKGGAEARRERDHQAGREVIAATNKNLEEEIKKGNFGRTLYYRFNQRDRLNTVPPPLRERITDVPLLVEHFLKKLNQQNGKQKTMEEEALRALMGYDWPGNVRQLESIVERAYIMGEEDTIALAHLPREVKQEKKREGHRQPGDSRRGP